MRNFLSAILLLTSICGFAQISEMPIARPSADQHLNNQAGRTEAEIPITLPFWDDFSTSQGQLDTTWWMPGSQVQVLPRPGNGVLPPTLNVVTFDGVDAAGIPYSPTATTGPTDSLLSRFIDLTQVPANLRSSVYLSFFFQKKGNGNQPEPEDSLILYFKKIDGNWQKVWPLPTDIVPDDPTIFTEKLINVPNTSDYFYPEFQFKFEARGRQNGWFDNWNIDYIYMDKRRNSNDNSYLDRALTDHPASILGEYMAMPFNEFMYESSPETYLSTSNTWIRTLENDTQPIQYTVTVRDTLNDLIIETIANDLELLMFPKDVKQAPTNLPNPNSFNPNADSLFLEIKYEVSTGDKNLIDSIYNAGADTVFYDKINLRVNDTARTYITIHDYFAYDDGSAEYGAGINQSSGRIAYQFVTKNPQYIDRVDIYFPNIRRNQAGTPIEVFILKNVDDISRPYEGITTAAIDQQGLNTFSSYYFANSVYVQDTFYIGFVNKAADQLWTAVGLDKNTDTGDKIYYTFSNTWVQNSDIVGSLMMRPHFVKGFITGLNSEVPNLEIYPNPSNGRINLRGDFSELEIVDIIGRKVNFSIQRGEKESQVTIHDQPDGLVLLSIVQHGKIITHKLVIRN